MKSKLLFCFTCDLDTYDLLARKILRPDLYELLRQANSVQRFERLGLPKDAIAGETVYSHILRLVCRVESLLAEHKLKDDCLKIVLMHDLPETYLLIGSGKTSDITATEKAVSAKLDQAVENDEDKAAESIFTEEEFMLYKAFSQASEYLKGRSKEVPTGVGLICKILDKIDGDLFFHKTVISNLGDLAELSDKGQSLAFEQYVTYSERLASLKESKASEMAGLGQRLLNDFMLTIKEMWVQVSDNQVPVVIKKCLTEMRIR